MQKGFFQLFWLHSSLHYKTYTVSYKCVLWASSRSAGVLSVCLKIQRLSKRPIDSFRCLQTPLDRVLASESFIASILLATFIGYIHESTAHWVWEFTHSLGARSVQTHSLPSSSLRISPRKRLKFKRFVRCVFKCQQPPIEPISKFRCSPDSSTSSKWEFNLLESAGV